MILILKYILYIDIYIQYKKKDFGIEIFILYTVWYKAFFVFIYLFFFTNQTEVRGPCSAVELTNIFGAIYSYEKRASRITA